MKKVLFVLAVSLASCTMGEVKPCIEQEVRIDSYAHETVIATFVWYNKEIIWSKFDPIEQADSAFIANRYKQAEEIVKRIKACR